MDKVLQSRLVAFALGNDIPVSKGMSNEQLIAALVQHEVWYFFALKYPDYASLDLQGEHVEKARLSRLRDLIGLAKTLVKSNCPTPPSGGPPRPGLVWNPQTCRWILPPDHEVPEPTRDRTNDTQSNQPIVRGDRFDQKALEEVIEHAEIDFNPPDQPTYKDVFEYTDPAAYALDQYIGNTGYRLNEALRNGGLEKLKQSNDSRHRLYADTIQTLVHSMAPMGKPQRLFRGIDNWYSSEKPEPGKRLSIDAFASASRHPVAAFGFAVAEDNPYSSKIAVVLDIETTPETRAITMDNSLGGLSEYETILDFDQEFIIDEVIPHVEIPRADFKKKVHYLRGRVVPKESVEIAKSNCPSPPGPPPRPGLVWSPQTCRWIRPKDAPMPEVPAHETTKYPRFSDGINRVNMETLDLRAEAEDVKQSPAYGNPKTNFSLEKYVENHFTDINESLRTGKYMDESKADIKKIIDDMKPLQQRRILYRGIGISPEDLKSDRPSGGKLLPGDTLTADSFMSTSRSPKTAIGNILYHKGSNRTFIEIETRPDTEGIHMSNEDTTFPEQETLLNVGQKFYVEDVWRGTNVPHPFRNESMTVNYIRVVAMSPEYSEQVNLSKSNCPTPPGPPPRPGLVWNPQTCRWVRPEEQVMPQAAPQVEQQPIKESGIIAESPFADDGIAITEQALFDYEYLNDDIEIKESPAYYDPEREKHSGNAERMLVHSAIYDYTGNEYEGFNERMRKNKLEPQDQIMMKRIQSAMKPIGESPILFRGMSGFPTDPETGRTKYTFNEGEVLPLDTFTSTSRNPEVAIRFSDAHRPEKPSVVFEIHPDPNTKGIVLPDSTRAFLTEYETILDMGQKIQIEKVYDNIEAEHVEYNPDELIEEYEEYGEEYDEETILGYRPTVTYVVARMVSDEANVIQKAPPGPKPPHFGDDVYWDERTRRWRKPEDEERWRMEERSEGAEYAFHMDDFQIRNLFEKPGTRSLERDLYMNKVDKYVDNYEHKSILLSIRRGVVDDQKTMVITSAYSHPDTVRTGGMREIMDIVEDRARKGNASIEVSVVLNPHLLNFLSKRGYISLDHQNGLGFEEWKDRIDMMVDPDILDGYYDDEDLMNLYEAWGGKGFYPGVTLYKHLGSKDES